MFIGNVVDREMIIVKINIYCLFNVYCKSQVFRSDDGWILVLNWFSFLWLFHNRWFWDFFAVLVLFRLFELDVYFCVLFSCFVIETCVVVFSPFSSFLKIMLKLSFLIASSVGGLWCFFFWILASHQQIPAFTADYGAMRWNGPALMSHSEAFCALFGDQMVLHF